MFIENDFNELLEFGRYIIESYRKGDFIIPGEAINLAYIKMHDANSFYEKGVFKKIMSDCVRDEYRKKIALSAPVNLDGIIYGKMSKTRTCACCNEDLPTAAFRMYFNTKYEGLFLSSYCVICLDGKSKAYDLKEPKKLKARIERRNVKRKELRKQERIDLTDEYMIKLILKKLPAEWLIKHPEYIDKERRILRRKLEKKIAA